MADVTIGTIRAKNNGPFTVEQSGEAIGVGKAVYRLSNGKHMLLDATQQLQLAGIAITSTTATDQYFILAQPGAIVDLGAVLTLNAEYRISTTSGGITTDAPVSLEYNNRIGTAIATDQLAIDPYLGAITP